MAKDFIDEVGYEEKARAENLEIANDIHDLLESCPDLSEWEAGFLEDMQEKLRSSSYTVTPAQKEKIEEIMEERD